MRKTKGGKGEKGGKRREDEEEGSVKERNRMADEGRSITNDREGRTTEGGRMGE